MPPDDLSDDPKLLTSAEVAEYLRMSNRNLQRLRAAGLGPPFRRVNRRPLYDRDELAEWSRQQNHDSGTVTWANVNAALRWSDVTSGPGSYDDRLTPDGEPAGPEEPFEGSPPFTIDNPDPDDPDDYDPAPDRMERPW